ncbi:MAG: hypothetical protein ACRETY_14720 [Steroidobacteraceae bacterium]
MNYRRMRSWVVGFLLSGVAVVAFGCGTSAPSADTRPPKNVSAPQITDEYVRLSRKQLTDPDPRAVQREINCEIRRLGQLLGDQEAFTRMEAAEDTVFTWRDRAARERVDRALANHVFYYNDGCDTRRPTDTTRRDSVRGQ